MPTPSRAWFLYPGDDAPAGALAPLRCEPFTVPDPGPGEVLVETLYGSWEANYHHALLRDPVDVCHLRGENRVVLGNAGVVRALAAGPGVEGVEPGRAYMIYGGGEVDRHGFMTRALAYDAVGTMGVLAERFVLPARCVAPIPADTRYSLAQWAAFSVRYVTAWANWKLAYGTLRLQLDPTELPAPHVWGWGGGTTLAELDLARRHGCRAVMITGRPSTRALAEEVGLTPLDRRRFAALDADPADYPDEAARRAAQQDAERAFMTEVTRRTEGDGVHVFVDYIGTPMLRATLKALGRNGVLTTAGWKHGMRISLRRAVECIERRQHIHTHYARRSECLEAMAYGEAEGWMPPLDTPIAKFDDVPALAQRYADGQTGYFPVFATAAAG